MAAPHRHLEQLRKLAAANPTKRLGQLRKMMRHDAFLQMVWQKGRSNQGSRTPGVDGHMRDNIDEHVLHDLAHDLATRRYRPQPVRRTDIPKRGKPGQWRG